MSRYVEERYGKKILMMRDEGQTLAEIGRHYGITKERVRQIIVGYRGTTEIDTLASINKIASQIGCSRDALKKKLSQRGIALVNVGRISAIPSSLLPDVNQLVKDFRSPTCRVCGAKVPKGRRFFCSTRCSLRWHDKLGDMRPEHRALHVKATRKWQQNNPERVRQIRLRCHRKLRERESLERYETVTYITTKEFQDLKAGSEVRVPPGRPKAGYYYVESNSKIYEVPISIVRRKKVETYV